MAGTPQRGSGGGVTPGRASVRDKLNINPEEALMEEYEAGFGAKQQQARICVPLNCEQSLFCSKICGTNAMYV